MHQLGFFGMQGPGGGGAVAAGVNKALQTVSVFVFADLLFCDEAAMAAGLPADDEAIRETMAALDTNRDGVVSLEEFKAAPRAVSWWEKNDF